MIICAHRTRIQIYEVTELRHRRVPAEPEFMQYVHLDTLQTPLFYVFTLQKQLHF